MSGKKELTTLCYIERDDAYTETDMRFFDKELLRHINCVPNEYLYYFYYRERAVENVLHTGTERMANETPAAPVVSCPSTPQASAIRSSRTRI